MITNKLTPMGRLESGGLIRWSSRPKNRLSDESSVPPASGPMVNYAQIIRSRLYVA